MDKVKMAEWKTFNEQAAVCHLFMQGCKSDEARKACFKILTDTPAGCTKTLMEKLAEIDAFPTDGRGPGGHKKAVKTDLPVGERKVCTDCKRVGHLKADCWGKCSFCGRFGHKSEICRTRLRSDQTEALKKANLKKDKERKIKKDKIKKKTKAKKVRDFLDMFEANSPESSEAEVVSSDEESSDPEEQSPGPAVKKIHETAESRREARVYAYAENISDEEVIETINLTKIASKSKIKKVMSKKGRSYTHAAVSKYSNFRKSKTETLLLDTGAGVNIAGEDIIKDSGIKVYKLKHERQVTEASGNQLDIIGVCELYVKLDCLKKVKKN